MAVMLVTSVGELVVDLFTDLCPLATKNFLKLCKYVFIVPSHACSSLSSHEFSVCESRFLKLVHRKKFPIRTMGPVFAIVVCVCACVCCVFLCFGDFWN